MEDRDRVTEPFAEPADRLRRESDLGHEHDRAEAARECRLARLEVHLRLAAPGRPDEQEVRARRPTEPGGHASDGDALLGGERGGRRLTGERLSLGRRPSLPARCAAEGCDELERARRRRAVVVGDPERQVDEHRGDLAEHLAGRGEHDPRRSLDVDLGNHAAGGAAAQADLQDRTLADVVRYVVGEGPRYRA